MEWTKESGPGEIRLGDSTAEDTAVKFSAPGVYVLRLTADDSELQGSDTLTLRVLPVEEPPVVQFLLTESSGEESVAEPIFDLVLNKPSPDPVTVEYHVTEISATDGEDFILTNGMVTFSPMATEQGFTVTVLEDETPESSEAFLITILNPVNAELGAQNEHAIRLWTTIAALRLLGLIMIFRGKRANFFPTLLGIPQTRVRASLLKGDGGLMIDYDSGEVLPVTLDVVGGTWAGGPHASKGNLSQEGTDAYDVFNGKVDATGIISYSDSDLVLTLSGLSQELNYSVVLFGNRGNPSYTDRLTEVLIQGADSFTNESTPGSDFTGPSADTSRLVNGYNDETGHVA